MREGGIPPSFFVAGYAPSRLTIRMTSVLCAMAVTRARRLAALELLF